MSIAGTWQVSMDTPIGTQKFTWSLAQANGAWVGTMQGPTGAATLNSIAVDGNAFSCETDVTSPMGTIHLAFRGACSGDTITGKCSTMFGDQTFAGTRG
jgi:hypothetical protein